MGNFVEEQKAINAQLNQKIKNVEGCLNKRIDGLEGSLNQKIDNLQSSITRLTNQQQVQEQGKFPSQTLPNPRGVHEIGSASNPAPRMDGLKAVVTLRSGKQVDQPVPKLAKETREEEEVEPEHIFIKEDSMKRSMPPPFPQELRGKKKASEQAGILEVLRQVKVNIPLLDMIKQVPTYAKFLKDLAQSRKGWALTRKPS